MGRLRCWGGLALLMLCLAGPVRGAVAAEAQPVSAAVFDFELIDTSLEGASRGIDPAETARLKLISQVVRDLLRKSGRYEVIDIAPAAARIADAGLIHSCNGCDADIARDLGAARAITGKVWKVSTLILSISITVRDAKTGAPVQAATADIRGNTDQSWTHGTSWLVRNRLLAK